VKKEARQKEITVGFHRHYNRIISRTAI